jgi:hypothetical protein
VTVASLVAWGSSAAAQEQTPPAETPSAEGVSQSASPIPDVIDVSPPPPPSATSAPDSRVPATRVSDGIDSPSSPSATSRPTEIHGFASQGFMVTSGNDYLVADSKNGSFQLSEVGVNLTKEISDKLRFGAQAFAQNFGLGGNFDLRADWFYLDYRARDWFGLRFGRLKIPFGLYNDVNDVDSARTPILLPQSTYPLQNRSFLFAQNGAEVYGFARSRSAGALEYRLYAGTIFIDPAILVPPGSTVELQFNVRYVVGGRLFWETPLSGLRVGGSVLATHLKVTAFAGGMTIPIQNRSVLAMGSAEYTLRRVVLTAEYARWLTDQESAIPTSNFDITSERAYAMVSYRMTPWLQPAAYYALYFPDVTNREGGSAFKQHDVALTLRFDVTEHWIVKLEGHYMEGTAGLVSPLSVTPAPSNPANRWGVLLLKMTGYF